MIYDKLEDIDQASKWYERSINVDKPQRGSRPSLGGSPVAKPVDRMSQCYVKAASNLAVCREKLGDRLGAIQLLEELKFELREDQKTFLGIEELSNNLGVIQKRQKQLEKSEESYKLAMQVKYKEHTLAKDELINLESEEDKQRLQGK